MGLDETAMSNVSLQDLQRDPLAILARVEAGESLLIMRDHQPVAELRPHSTTAPTTRPFGLAAGAFVVPADFDAPLPESILDEFERG